MPIPGMPPPASPVPLFHSPLSPPALSRADYVRDFSLPKVPASFVDKLSMDFLALATKQSVENLYFSRAPNSSQEGGFRL